MNNKASRLLQRYLSAIETGKEPYFDVDEIDELLGGFEDDDDYSYYKDVLVLGLKLHPGNTDLQLRKCRYYILLEDYDKALALIESIARVHDAEADKLRLECYCLTKQYDKIVEHTEDLIQGDCDYTEDIFEHIAPILSDLEMDNEARDFLRRGMALFPDNLVLKEEKCFYLEEDGRIDEAIALCNELIDKDPYSYEYWFSLGRLYSLKAEYDKAIEVLDFASACDDSDPELKLMRAYCFYKNGNYAKAVEMYKTIEPEMEEDIKPFLADCYIMLEDFESAYNQLKSLVDEGKATTDAEVYINFIRCCIETERYNDIAEQLDKANRLFPQNIQVLSFLALAYTKVDRTEDAKDASKRLFDILAQKDSLPLEECEYLFRAGKYLCLNGDFEEAIKYLNEVCRFQPNMPNLHFFLTICHMMSGDIQNFAKHIKHVSSNKMQMFFKDCDIHPGEFTKEEQRVIPPQELTKEFLKDKSNSN